MVPHVPEDLIALYEVHDWRHAAVIFAHDFRQKFEALCAALRSFRFTKAQVQKAGGNESEIPKTFSSLLRPRGWRERKLTAKLIVDDHEMSHDTHKIDYIKDHVAYGASLSVDT